jgi:putative redox protein
MFFSASSDSNECSMDAKKPIGRGAAMTPKELVIAGLCGCTAMDVMALMKKHRAKVDSCCVSAQVEMTDSGHPAVFKSVSLSFQVAGVVEADKLVEAVKLSQTQYCGVSAMLSKAVPIRYEIELNGTVIGTGEANFS